MARSPKKVFNKTYTVSTRKDYIDFDYIGELDDESRAWLAKFTDEYYGASFTINTTFVEKDELIPHLKKIIHTEKNPKKKVRLQNQLEYYSRVNRVYLQISNHANKSLNIDLRKVRSISRYYKTPSGRLSTDEKYKYSTSNVQGTEYLQDCNKRSNAISEDIYNVSHRNELVVDDGDIDLSVRTFAGEYLSTEDQMIKEEEDYELDRILDL